MLAHSVHFAPRPSHDFTVGRSASASRPPPARAHRNCEPTPRGLRIALITVRFLAVLSRGLRPLDCSRDLRSRAITARISEGLTSSALAFAHRSQHRDSRSLPSLAVRSTHRSRFRDPHLFGSRSRSESRRSRFTRFTAHFVRRSHFGDPHFVRIARSTAHFVRRSSSEGLIPFDPRFRSPLAIPRFSLPPVARITPTKPARQRPATR
jgi:hypothetical protein